MAYQEQNRRNAPARNNQIPRRVEDAAQSMSDRSFSGPRRGYIPPDPGRMKPAPGSGPRLGGQGYVGQEYYNSPNSRQAYYSGQSQLTGGQRGFVMPPSGQMNQPPKKKKDHHGINAVLIILLVAALGTGGYFAVTNYQHTKKISEKVEPYNELFCPGVYVDGIHLGGMTYEQAMNSVQSQIQQRHDAWKVSLNYNGAKVIEINADMLQFNVDPTDVLAQAWQQGHSGDQEQRYDEMSRLEKEPYQAFTAKPEGNTGIIDQKLAQIKAAIDTPAVNAEMTGFDWSLIYPFIFTDESYGRSLDTEPIKERLYQMASTMESGELTLEPERLIPSVTKADLMKHYKLRSDVYTPIDRHSSENRNNNIKRAFELINGYKLEPGRTFSFNKVVGERTESRGFYEAVEYVYDEHVIGIGGGVCQASTTVYQAAVCAGLQIQNRVPHSDSVSYCEYGKDATVYWFKGGKKIDFTFKNNTDQDIYILALVQTDPQNKKRLIARVIIYGEDMGDTRYELETVEVETLPCLLQPRYVSSKEETAKAKEGHVVDSYRVEYTNGAETDRIKLFRDTYDPKPEKIYDPSMADRD